MSGRGKGGKGLGKGGANRHRFSLTVLLYAVVIFKLLNQTGGMPVGPGPDDEASAVAALGQMCKELFCTADDGPFYTYDCCVGGEECCATATSLLYGVAIGTPVLMLWLGAVISLVVYLIKFGCP